MTSKRSAQSPLLLDGQPVGRLLVPVVADQRHDRGVAVAMQLAAAWGVSVVLLHIGPLDVLGASSAVADLAVELRRHHPNVSVETIAFDHADVAAAIIEAGDEGTLTVLASDHASEWLGNSSVAERLVQRGSAPLLLIGPNAAGFALGGEVIVGLDGTPLAEDGVGPGIALAAAAGTAVRVVSVIPTATVEHIDHLKGQGQRVSESAYLRALAEGLPAGPAPVAWEVIHDENVIDALVELADRRHAALIVATTHSGTGLPRQRFGSTSMGLVERSTVPVMIVHPVRRQSSP